MIDGGYPRFCMCIGTTGGEKAVVQPSCLNRFLFSLMASSARSRERR